MTRVLNSVSQVETTADYVHISFSSPQRILSSAVLNGGFVQADHILNWKVSGDPSISEAPDKSLREFALQQGWQGEVVGMMTAASMNSFRMEQVSQQGIDFTVLVTSGLSNARRAGDKADIQDILLTSKEIGTINLVLICSAQLTDAAMVEAIMVATEAKAAALQEAGIESLVSGGVATGTGTDSIAVVSGDGPATIEFCGKHVLLGEWIGRLVLKVVSDSISE